MFKNFIEMESMLIRKKMPVQRLALVSAQEISALRAVYETAERGYIEPVLIGNAKEIETLLIAYNMPVKFPIINALDSEEAAQIAIKMVRNEQVDILMKGMIQTSDLLKEVVNRERGIRKQAVLSHIAMIEIPYLDRMFLISDGGMMPYPDLVQKEGIIENAITVAHQLGIHEPKVALLDAAEHTNIRIASSMHSEKLAQKAWLNAQVEGPISIDIALSAEAANKKRYNGAIHGNADVLIVPDIISGNILGKVGTLFTDGKMAGIVVGAAVPIVLTSRGASMDEKMNSILISCFIANEEGN